MLYRKMGRTGLNVSEFCLGTMQWGWTADEAAGVTVMDAFVTAGGNFIDTADIYSSWAENNPGGVSEEIIGRWMQARANRHDIVLATKVRGRMWPGPNGEGLSRLHIVRACEDSLRRLQTEYIDLYQTHWFDTDTPIDETLEALDRLVRQGKVRYIGCSNYPAWRLMESLWVSDRRNLARYDCIQPHYSLVHRAEFEREVQEVCMTFGLGVIPYSPLAGGFLTGKYRRGAETASARAAGIKNRYMNDTGWAVLDAVEQVALQRGATATQIALAWQLNQPHITAPIIGANTPQQLGDALGASGLALSGDEMALLNQASQWA